MFQNDFLNIASDGLISTLWTKLGGHVIINNIFAQGRKLMKPWLEIRLQLPYGIISHTISLLCRANLVKLSQKVNLRVRQLQKVVSRTKQIFKVAFEINWRLWRGILKNSLGWLNFYTLNQIGGPCDHWY